MSNANPAAGRDTIKVGVIADQTGPLSFVGIANTNVARMVVGDINARGGLLGRRLELHLEDGATDDAVAAARAAKLVEQDRVDVIFGGIYSSTRQAIKGPAVVEGKTLYIYPEQYEGQESDPLIFCTGPVPAQQVDPFVPWMMRETGAKRFYLPSADYIWPHVMNARIREVVTANGGKIVGEEYFPLDHMEYRETVARIVASEADAVFNTIVPPGVTPFLEELYDSGFSRRGGQLICTYFDDNFLNMVPAAQVEGLYGCLDYYQAVDDPFTASSSSSTTRCTPATRRSPAAADARPLPRPAALGRRRDRGRLPSPGGRHRRARPRRARRGPGRAGGHGAGPAPPADEHVHRSGARRPLRGRQGARGDRPAGAQRHHPRSPPD